MLIHKAQSGIWPKRRPDLTREQRLILEDWYKYWLGVMPTQFRGVVHFNNEYPLRTYRRGVRTLEIGAGTGDHIRFENTTEQEYVALELRPNLAKNILIDFPNVHTIVGDCERRIEVPDASIDRVIA